MTSLNKKDQVTAKKLATSQLFLEASQADLINNLIILSDI